MTTRRVIGTLIIGEQFLEVADADMLRAAEKEGSLEHHLANAWVFGIAEQWTKRLALLGAAGAVGAWASRLCSHGRWISRR